MDVTVTIVMMIPVILAVALIINVIRKNLTEREAGDPVNITGVIPAVIVLVVAVMIIGSMGAAIAPYSYDEDSGELTINSDVGSGSQEWDSYGTDVKSLILNENVTTVADGAFDTLTGLEYISISDSVESITSSAFGVTLKDYMDQVITEPEAGEYVGEGDGTLYLADDSIFTYSTNGAAVTGLTSEASTAKNLVLPISHNGISITSLSNNAFSNNTSIAKVMALPGEYALASTGTFVFNGCTSLVEASVPDSVAALGYRAFYGCTALTTVSIQSVTSIGAGAFQNCGSLVTDLPAGVVSIGNNVFNNCTSLTALTFPSTVESVDSYAFNGCTGVTTVTFASGFAPSALNENAFRSWTFYDSDGTTALDRTVASNLAGFTFQGTASALVKQVPDLLGSPEDTEEQELVQPVEEIEEAEDTEMLVPEQSETKTEEALSVEEKELQTFEMDATEQELASA